MTERLDALTVREHNGKSYWTKIGVAWPNKNGAGYTVGNNNEAGSGDKAFNVGIRHAF